MKTKQEILDDLQKYYPHSIPTFKAMDEWAKQQAVAFLKFCIPSAPDFDAKIYERYAQFIESQNKPTTND